MGDDIQTGSYAVRDSQNKPRTVLILTLRTERPSADGPGYQFGDARHLLDGKGVSRIEKGLYQVDETGEYLTSNDPVAP
ncbi:hypothetical protein [Limnoglobus roseus]|uniref:Uncharacterized protein n=1 Tax=Limnoglobus roseus TaxID=2598579 RepID=A0A5C1AKL8_9BACT|nr:hypothetical protein [Limnoglobus roseus]QEL17704.1 hypothetical protein PX52LOC_04703 [Limnoglobus roseus]